MMIQAHFGLTKLPFNEKDPQLLEQQQKILDMILIHAQQGGFCLILGEAGTGKSLIKEKLIQYDSKQVFTPVVNRTLHTYHNTLRILCEAFDVESSTRDSVCERALVDEAFKLHRSGKQIVPIIDDAHLMPADSLRKLRLLCEDFPRSHNLVLIGQPALLHTLSLSINQDVKNRITYSEELKKLIPDDIESFVRQQLESSGLGSHVFTPEAISLIARSSDGFLRTARNLSLNALVEAVRDQKRNVDIQHVNNALRQPHWRSDYDYR